MTRRQSKHDGFNPMDEGLAMYSILIVPLISKLGETTLHIDYRQTSRLA
ncbi:MAG: hypothetical protein M2R45_01838 [Verrucomicrobia subdivision 3 bacterium]|nr:hypothetical protein [Limisphaerales bacterium]MCS1415638.1 hypothetical protein [Limisphaerales bacterium]